MRAEEARKISEAVNNQTVFMSEFLCMVDIRAAANEGKNVVVIKGIVTMDVRQSLREKGYQVHEISEVKTQIIW